MLKRDFVWKGKKELGETHAAHSRYNTYRSPHLSLRQAQKAHPVAWGSLFLFNCSHSFCHGWFWDLKNPPDSATALPNLLDAAHPALPEKNLPVRTAFFITCQRMKRQHHPGIRVFLPHLPPGDHILIVSLDREVHASLPVWSQISYVTVPELEASQRFPNFSLPHMLS